MSRTPQSGFLARRLASNASLLCDVCAPPRMYGPAGRILPAPIRDIDGEGRLDVRQVACGRPRLDGSVALHVHLAGLESEGGQSLREVRHVLPGAAADLAISSRARRLNRS